MTTRRVHTTCDGRAGRNETTTRHAIGLMACAALALISGCGKPAGATPKVEMGPPEAPVWEADMLDARQTATARVSLAMTDASGERLFPEGASLQAEVFLGALSAPPADATREQIAEARRAITSAEGVVSASADLDQDGHAQVTLDITAVRPGKQTLIAFVNGMYETSFEAVASAAWERPISLVASRGAEGAEVVSHKVMGVPGTVTVEYPGKTHDDLVVKNLLGDPAVTITARGQVVSRDASVPLPFVDGVAKLSSSLLAGRGSAPALEWPLEVAIAGAEPRTFTIASDAVRVAGGLMATVRKALLEGRSVPLPGDSGVNGSRSMAIFGSDQGYMLGADVALAEIDLYAVVATGPGSDKRCGPYSVEGRESWLEIKAPSLDVAVYDRRAAKTIATRAFPSALPPCPASFLAAKVSSHYAMDVEMKDGGRLMAWLQSLLKP